MTAKLNPPQVRYHRPVSKSQSHTLCVQSCVFKFRGVKWRHQTNKTWAWNVKGKKNGCVFVSVEASFTLVAWLSRSDNMQRGLKLECWDLVVFPSDTHTHVVVSLQQYLFVCVCKFSLSVTLFFVLDLSWNSCGYYYCMKCTVIRCKSVSLSLKMHVFRERKQLYTVSLSVKPRTLWLWADSADHQSTVFH